MVEPDDQCAHGEHYLRCPIDTTGACRRGETAPAPLLQFPRPQDGGPPPVVLRPRRVDPPDLIA